MKKKINRREFVKSSSKAAIGIAIGASAFSSKSYARIIGANERINFAVVGLHGRGYAHLDAVSECKNAYVTHICDVDSNELQKFAVKTNEYFGDNFSVEKDFRNLLDEKDLDVITIATPEHWHAHMTIMGLQAGKHVYVEKPCSHNPNEGKLIIEAQKKYKKLVQMGNQQRSSLHTIDIMDRIHNGIIGKPYMGKAWYSNTRGTIGLGKEVPVPEHLDWELWQGPAPRKVYKDNIHPYNWHWFWHWGTGETLNNGTHEVDLCRWALGVEYPNRINSAGGRYHFKDDWEFYDTLITNFEYEDKLISWEGKSCQGKPYFGRGRGATIHGMEGTVLIDRDGYEIYDLKNNKIEEYVKSEKDDKMDVMGKGPMTIKHFQNLINGIRTGEKLHSPIEEGNIAVTMLQHSNIAWKLNRTLDIDDQTGSIINDEEASKLESRNYEKGWELTV